MPVTVCSVQLQLSEPATGSC